LSLLVSCFPLPSLFSLPLKAYSNNKKNQIGGEVKKQERKNHTFSRHAHIEAFFNHQIHTLPN